MSRSAPRVASQSAITPRAWPRIDMVRSVVRSSSTAVAAKRRPELDALERELVAAVLDGEDPVAGRWAAEQGLDLGVEVPPIGAQRQAGSTTRRARPGAAAAAMGSTASTKAAARSSSPVKVHTASPPASSTGQRRGVARRSPRCGAASAAVDGPRGGDGRCDGDACDQPPRPRGCARVATISQERQHGDDADEGEDPEVVGDPVRGREPNVDLRVDQEGGQLADGVSSSSCRSWPGGRSQTRWRSRRRRARASTAATGPAPRRDRSRPGRARQRRGGPRPGEPRCCRRSRRSSSTPARPAPLRRGARRRPAPTPVSRCPSVRVCR